MTNLNRDLHHPWTYRTPPPPDYSGPCGAAWCLAMGAVVGRLLWDASAPMGVCIVVGLGSAASLWIALGEG